MREMTREELLRVDGIKPGSTAWVKSNFGGFTYKESGGGRVTIDKAWREQNLETVMIPQLKGLTTYENKKSSGKTVVHRLMAKPFVRAFELIEALGLTHCLKQWGGAWVPRHISWSRDMPLSTHTYGVAFDLNVPWNPYKGRPAERGTPGSLYEILGIFEACGFGWGGWWNASYRDGMHFNAFRIVPDDEIPVWVSAEPPEQLETAQTYYQDHVHAALKALYEANSEILFPDDEDLQHAWRERLNNLNGLLISAGVK